ncbi:hypothetical protein A2642_00310 [Candidatus Nomurabacteria bacterium RIFCSPHIGHO2_01_FULL_39_10]|uniref:Uncharacterized protein n=1 Tax=Candidatus Nomurabacteria bacterium RIFCSPHIGHO2_01_FULL_39_10 TaxID=1801733 RepID=A0A1F6V3X8_9BACT|nr:MAG: hypothetical protein A2642_00310 [Candidatus Nomurabacteria bacterium RIFCSPHIGHO2_01_FULL_39_10]
MTFEDKLKELTDTYNVFPNLTQQEAMTKTLIETFQATEVKYEQAEDWDGPTTCTIMLPAPGLRTYCNIDTKSQPNPWRKEAITYQSKNTQPTLPLAENGWIAMYLRYKKEFPPTESIDQIRFSFSCDINFPQFDANADLNRRRYRYKTQNGEFYAYWDEDVDASYLSNKISEGYQRDTANRIHLSQTIRGGKISWIGINQKTLGLGILTDFFEDIGYQGLEKLL